MSRLKPLGFKKNGIHYYKISNDGKFVMQIQNGWKFSDELLLSFAWLGLKDFKTDIGKIKVPQSMFKFPIVIPLEDVQQQIRSHKEISKFKVDLNPITRYSLTTRHLLPLDLMYIKNQVKTMPKYLTIEYLDKSINTILKLTDELLNQINLTTLYLSTHKYPKELVRKPISVSNLNTLLINQAQEIVKELERTKQRIPILKQSKLRKIQLWHHYRKMNNVRTKEANR